MFRAGGQIKFARHKMYARTNPFSKRLRCPRHTPFLALFSYNKEKETINFSGPKKTQKRKSRKQRPPCALECVRVLISSSSGWSIPVQ
jgi:hypothetical protein